LRRVNYQRARVQSSRPSNSIPGRKQLFSSITFGSSLLGSARIRNEGAIREEGREGGRVNCVNSESGEEQRFGNRTDVSDVQISQPAATVRDFSWPGATPSPSRAGHISDNVHGGPYYAQRDPTEDF